MSKSASLPAEPPPQPFDPQSSESATSQWKQEVNQRLAAHRNRRGGTQDVAGSRMAENPRTASARAAEAAARVAARYAKAPSYSELLAGEARAVVRAAGAAAVAARNAQAAAEAVLAGLESSPIASGLWEPEAQTSASDMNANALRLNAASHAAPSAPARWQDEPPASAPPSAHIHAPENAWAGAQPRWEEALPVTSPAPPAGRDVWSEMRVHPTTNSSRESAQDYRQNSERHYGRRNDRNSHEGELFPHETPHETFDPFDTYDLLDSATVEPVQHLPANLIEFPRELVATRRARPRLAEGPFYDASHENSQLSIFEVDPDLLTVPDPSDSKIVTVAPPEWASIELDDLGHPDRSPEPRHSHIGDNSFVYAEHSYAAAVEVEASYADLSEMPGSAVEEMPLEPASVPVGNTEARTTQAQNSVAVAESPVAAELLVARLSDRLLAAVVDGALVTLAFLAAAVVVIASTAHPPTGRIALIASGCGLLIFGLLYQFLFLSYAEEGTPGMRYARIALCTFDDDNPTREQMRKRIPALLLSALPAGLGLLWALFDRDHLACHDRLTRTYQRKY